MKKNGKSCKPVECMESTLEQVLRRHLEWLTWEQGAKDPVYLAAALPVAIVDAARAALGVINNGARKHSAGSIVSNGCAGLKIAGNHFKCLKRLESEGLTPHRVVEERIRDLIRVESVALEGAGAVLTRLDVRLEPPRRRGKNSGELSRIGRFRVRLRIATEQEVVDAAFEGEAAGNGLEPDSIAERSVISGLAGEAAGRVRSAGSTVLNLKRGRRRPPIAGLKRAVLAVKVQPRSSRSQGEDLSASSGQVLEVASHASF